VAVEIVAQSVVVISFLGINAVFERYWNFNGLVQSFMKVTLHIHDWSGTNCHTANLNKYADIAVTFTNTLRLIITDHILIRYYLQADVCLQRLVGVH